MHCAQRNKHINKCISKMQIRHTGGGAVKTVCNSLPLLDLKVDPWPCPGEDLCQFALKSVHSFSKYSIHKLVTDK